MSEVSLKQLRCFVAVYTERSFTKAAKLLGMKQSPVSQAIAALERQLDQRLFDRGAREVTPTPAADALYPEALELRRRAESLPDLIAEARTGISRQRIRLGATSSAFPSIVSGALEAAKEDYSVLVSDGASTKLTQAVENGDIDICLIREFSGYREEERVAFREPLVAAVPEHHEFAARENISPEEISHEPVVTFKRDIAPIAFDLVANVFLQAGSRMRAVAYLSSEQAILALVSVGIGITLVPQSVALTEWKGVKFIPLRDAQATYPLTVRTAPGDPMGLLEPFTAALAQWAREQGLTT